MHQLKKLLFLLIICFIFSSPGNAQDRKPGIVEQRKEIGDSISVYYFFDSTGQIVSPRYIALDTSLYHFHHYQALQAQSRSNAGIGNTGLAYTSMQWNNRIAMDSWYSISAYDAYRLTSNNLPYYKLNMPFTVLAYTTGRNREQVFKGRHYQQVLRDLGVGVNFNLIKSNGAYLRQRSDNASVAFQALFRTHNKRYGIAGSYINNRFIHWENGGIANAAQFENNEEPTRDRVIVKLSNAENRLRESVTGFRQYLHLGKPDTQKSDSVIKIFKNTGTLVHSFGYQRLAMIYSDKNPGNGFYPDILLDSLLTDDSLVLHTVNNDAQWQFPLIESDLIKLNITSGLEHVFMHYRMHTINYKYNQLIPYFRPTLKVGKNLVIRANIQRVSGDFRNNDQEIWLSGTYRFGNSDPLVIEGKVMRSLITPGLFFHLFQSNHFAWDNTFEQQKMSELKLDASWRTTRAGFSLNSVHGFAYLDSLAHPAWFDNSFNVFSAFAESRLQLRHFTFDCTFQFQHVSEETALRLPSLILDAAISYERPLFKGALQAMGGIELFYNTDWFAPAYMPATRSFYIQNQFKTGSYPYVDIFVNLRIRRARLFLLLQHVNSGFSGYTYYMIPTYPMPDRAFKFGVNWMFYD